ncbi:MAG: hypothetical protein CMP22_04305 [Rickettsiales bacterium]|nr:hypothetical protein [Rickettsiales bacterium]
MATFTVSNRESLSVAVAIDAVKLELGEVMSEIAEFNGKRVPMRLSLRKAQLKSLLNALEAKKSQGVKKIYKKDVGFAFIVALVAMLIANRAQLEARNAALSTQFMDSNDQSDYELEKYFKGLLKQKQEHKLAA